MLNYNLHRGFDYIMFGSIILIVLMGITMIYSGTHAIEWAQNIWIRQTVWFGLGLAGMIAAILFDYQLLGKYSRLIFIIAIVLLICVLFGPSVRSAKSWFLLGPISFQPAEFAKLATIIVLAEYLSTKREGLNTLYDLLPTIGLAGLPILLILMQPDLGTTLVFLPIYLMMLYVTGIRTIYLVTLTSTGVLIIIITLFVSWVEIQPKIANIGIVSFLYKIFGSFEYSIIFLIVLLAVIVGIYYAIKMFHDAEIKFTNFLLSYIIIGVSMFFSLIIDSFLKEYQRKRILVFIDPNIDPLGAGYNIIQSKIAIGSGKLFGKGLLNGTQNQLGFLPERQTDFIFSVLGEELGFIGAMVLLFLFCVIIYRGIAIAFSSRDMLGCLLAAGIISMIAGQIFINIGIATGIMPVTGLTLPLVSYGGSSLFITMVSLGIVLNIRLRRYLM
ncbi:MAG: rod shape-determining protein RodA [bacterium]|nr:rod shape-determining protein RodA [bacterium]